MNSTAPRSCNAPNSYTNWHNGHLPPIIIDNIIDTSSCSLMLDFSCSVVGRLPLQAHAVTNMF